VIRDAHVHHDRDIDRNRGRRQWPALLACLALLFQLFAPMSPMPMAAAKSGGDIRTVESLATALADLCISGSDRTDDRGKPATPGHGCQICISIDLNGHYVTPAITAVAGSAVLSRIAFAAIRPAAPVAVPDVSVHARGPPALA